MAGSNTFGGTIKLEGEKAYREAITKINSSLKVTAEFSKNELSLFCNEKSKQKRFKGDFDSPLKTPKRPAYRWI